MIKGPPKICLARLQCIFRELLLRYILNGAHEYGSAVDVFDETADRVQMLQDPSEGHNSKAEVDIVASDGPLDHVVEQGLVLGVDNVPKHPDLDLGAGLEFADAVQLIGPRVFVGDQVRGETSHRAYLLGDGKMRV